VPRRAIILTVVTSGVVGWVYLLATTVSIISPDTLLDADNATGGTNVFAQVGRAPGQPETLDCPDHGLGGSRRPVCQGWKLIRTNPRLRRRAKHTAQAYGKPQSSLMSWHKGSLPATACTPTDSV
jgi:hypothetical protein